MKHALEQMKRIVKAMEARAPKVRSAAETARVAEISLRKLLHDLLDARRDSGLPPATVARSMQVPPSAVARLESGRHNPTLKTLARYAAAIGAAVEVKPPPRVPDDWWVPQPGDGAPPPAAKPRR